MRRPDAQVHAAAVALLVLALAGCTTLPPGPGGQRAGAVQMPPAPGEVKASYLVTWQGGAHTLQAEVDGLPERPAFLGNGSTGLGAALGVTLDVEDPDSGRNLRFRYQLLHGEGGRLVSASMTCSRDTGEGCVAKERRPLLVGDAWGLPGFLGLGPFLGTTLRPGTRVDLPLWDPSGSTTVTWSVAEAPGRGGKPCVWLEAPKPATSKAPVLLAPAWGRILACEDVPLPVRVEAGPLALDLRSSTANGTLRPPALPPLDLGPPRSGCALQVPPRARDTLPSRDYASWARANDPYIRDWFRQHPQGEALPGFGRLQALSDKPLSTWSVGVVVGLHDAEGGVLEPRLGSELWQRVATQETGAMQPSDGLSVAPSAVPARPMAEDCRGDPVDLAALADAVVRRSAFSVSDYTVMVAPEAGAAWQGSPKTMLPFIYLGPGWQEAFLPQAWPPRVYVTVSPSEAAQGVEVAQAGFITTADAALEPRTGWVRFAEVHEDAWPWG